MCPGIIAESLIRFCCFLADWKLNLMDFPCRRRSKMGEKFHCFNMTHRERAHFSIMQIGNLFRILNFSGWKVFFSLFSSLSVKFFSFDVDDYDVEKFSYFPFDSSPWWWVGWFNLIFSSQIVHNLNFNSHLSRWARVACTWKQFLGPLILPITASRAQ